MPSYSKADQLERGPKRPARVKATPLEWVELRRLKLGTCRCFGLGACFGFSELHHIVPRSQGGDDVASNLAPLCRTHHENVTNNVAEVNRRLAESLTDSEYAYVIGKLGEGGMERLFGIRYVAGEETP